MDNRKQLFDFHVAPPKDKADPKFGTIIAEQILQTVKAGEGSYFHKRNERIERNRQFARGAQDMQEFLDLMKIDGKESYVNLHLKPPPIAPKFVKILIQRFMERLERPTITAVDDVSKKQKQRKKDEAEFRMYMQGDVAQMEQEAGVPMEDANAFIPEDKDDLELHFELEDKDTDELLYEKGVWDVLQDGDYDVFKEKALNDLTKAGMVVSKVYLDDNKRIRYRNVLPENSVYLHSNYDDFRDCTLVGELIKMKVSEVRKLYGMDEKQLFEFYRSSTQNPAPQRTYQWTDDYISAAIRPYDDAIIEILDFELITTDPKIWLKKNDRNGRMVIEDKKEAPKNLGDNKELISKMYCVVYSGVYAVGASKMIRWKLCENQIKPHYALHEVFGSFVVTMPDNENMTNMAVVERMENSIVQMTMSLLKLQQLKSELRPDEVAINASSMQNIDLGAGVLPPFKVQEIFQQTGKLYYNGTGDDGETREAPPITPLPLSTAVQKMQALMNDYNFHLQLIRDMLGMNEASDGSGVGERMGMGVMQNQIGVSNRATDYIYNAYITHLNGIAKRIAILLWWNITAGGKQYQNVMQGEDIKEKVYDLQISMLPTDSDRQYIEALLQTAMANGFTLEEIMKVRRISKENVKLAEKYLAKYEKKRREQAMQENQANIQATSQAQQASNQQTHENMVQLKQVEIQGKIELQKEINKNDRTKMMADLIKMIGEQPNVGALMGNDRIASLMQAFADNLLGVQAAQNMDNEIGMQETQAAMQQQAMAEQQAMMQQQQQMQ